MLQESEKPYLDSETYIEGDKTVDSDLLTNDIEEALADLRDTRPEKRARITWYR